MSDVKEAFPSRWPGGVLLESDFSQLEVIGAAMLSGDEMLISDILSGMDMHRLRASELFHKKEEDVTPGERFTAKSLAFQLQYGAGAKSMAQKLNISKAIAEAFIYNYYTHYHRLKEWQDGIIEGIKRSRRPTQERLPSGAQRGRGEYESDTGRVYVFMEQDGFHGEPSFNPPTMKNYPIQGFATGDVMALFRAEVYRRWLRSDVRKTCLPVNTVHDSIMFDCYTVTEARKIKKLLDEVAADLPQMIRERWNIPTPLPFKIETKQGPTWADMRKEEYA